jgi:thiamine biosynthesis lipoprotein
MKRLSACLLSLFVLLGLTGCGLSTTDPDTAQESIQVIAMDTPMIFTIYGEQSTHTSFLVEDLVRELDSMLSRTDESSQVSALNDVGSGTVDAALGQLLLASAEYTAATDGAFDITVAPVVSAWGFTTDSYQVPSQSELDRLLTLVNGSAVQVTENAGGTFQVQLGDGQSIDLGAIAKGYLADQVADLFRENDIPRALARLGGNVLVWGDRPDGNPWRVGIQDPAQPGVSDAYAGVLELTDAYAVTSGSYERYFEENGKTYHHIIDPATGYPADSGLVSVTVVASCDSEDLNGAAGQGTMCDALSTALFVMGEEQALDFWRTSGHDFDLVLVTTDGRVVVTDGLSDVFTEIPDSGYTYETVS